MAQKATRQNGGFNSTIGTLSLGRNMSKPYMMDQHGDSFKPHHQT